MHITKAVITAAAPTQRALPLQLLVDRDGRQKPVLRIIVEEAVRAGAEEICVVVHPGDEALYASAVGDCGAALRFVPQDAPRGYGYAVYRAREFTGDDPFLHMVGDHVYVTGGEQSCAQQLVRVAEAQQCAVSAVQATRENQLPYFGAIGGSRVPETGDLFVVEDVIEKPSPTEAEQALTIPGLRAGYYLCFFGMHALTPTVMELLHDRVTAEPKGGGAPVQLSPVLAELARRERYLALEAPGGRNAVDGPYGLLYAQLALALSGRDRGEVLAGVCELLAQREMAHCDAAQPGMAGRHDA